MSTVSEHIVSDERAGELRTISHAVVKKDAKGLLQGRAVYAGDLAPRDSYVVRMLRSPHANARIVSIDTTKAKKINGIVAIYTYEDVPQTRYTLAGQSFREMSPYDTRILDQHVRYVGDEVAIVVGVDDKAITAAMRLIKVEYEVLPAVLDFREALGNETVVHDEDDIIGYSPMGQDFKRNLICTGENVVGDLDSAFAQADIVFENTYVSQATEQSMMEPFTAYAYTDAMDRVCVVSSTQVPFHIRRQVATALGLPQSRVRVTKPRVGGGFGAKQTGCNEVYVAWCAHKLGHPCKSVYTREEAMSCANTRHQMQMKVRMGAKSDGTILAIDLEVLSDGGAYGYHAPTTIDLAGSKSLPIYNHVLASRFFYQSVYTNRTPGGAFRGYGATQGQFAVESMVNELADKLGMDPCELRLKNIVHEGEILAQYHGEKLMSCRLDDCIRRAQEMIGWNEKPLVRDMGDKVRALGVAASMQGSGISNLDIGSADIRLEDDGFYVLNIGATDVGTGGDTILAQFAAEVLGCSTKRIVVNGVDTDTSPYDCGSYASSGTYVSGGAVVKAATQLREKIVEQAAKALGAEPEDIVLDGGRIYVTGDETDDDDVMTVAQIEAASAKPREMSLTDLANRCIGFGLQPGYLSGSASNSQPVSPPPFMCGIAEVDVDKTTGEVTVVDYVAAVDCGTVANANLARVQVEGGIAQGIGHALTEDVQYSEKGRMRTRNFMQYKIPTRMDVPDIRVDFCPSYEPTGPFGAKSIGEIVINTPLGAIASAVAHATGNYVRSLPITPEKALFGEE